MRPETFADLAVFSLDGDHAVDWLLESNALETYSDISPDGRWLVYISNESGQPEVYVRPFPNISGGRWQISRDGGFAPLWGPDSRDVFFQADGSPGTPVTMMMAENDTEPTFSPGIPRPLFDGRYRVTAYPQPRSFDVSPDGQRFLMIKEAEASEPSEQSAIIFVQNWIEELKNLFPGN